LEFKPIAFLGTVSYGLYIYHPFLFQKLGSLADRMHVPHGVIGFLLIASVSTLVAVASWYGFEYPINSLKRYFPYKVKKRTARAAEAAPVAMAK
jgi:peptidoglycan/LPS O-acetylase OafA/YrhL